jgi:hypothetical protein
MRLVFNLAQLFDQPRASTHLSNSRHLLWQSGVLASGGSTSQNLAVNPHARGRSGAQTCDERRRDDTEVQWEWEWQWE